LKVPNAALRYHPASDSSQSVRPAGNARAQASPEKAVWVLDGKDKPRRVVVTTGETDGAFTEVTGGMLNEGDRVILAALTTSAAAPTGTPGGGVGRGPGF